MEENFADRPCIIAPPPMIFAAFTALGGALSLASPLKIVSVSLLIRVLCALPVMLLSGGLVLLSVLAIRAAHTSINPSIPTTAIVTNGPYGFTRNPMYISLILLYIGIGILIGSTWFALLLPALFLVLHLGAVLREERYLRNKFPEQYADYIGRVRRWL